MRTLVFWGDAPLSRARARAEQGDLILLWGHRGAGREDAAFKSADWSAEKAARIEAAVTEWTRTVAEKPLIEGRPFRELFQWEGLSLWALVERFFLGPGSTATECVRRIESFGLVFETELPDEVEAAGLREDEVRLLERCCAAKGVLFQGDARRRVGQAPLGGTGRRDGGGLLGRLSAWRSVLAPARKPEVGTVVFVRPEGGPGESGDAFERLLGAARERLTITVVGGGDGLALEDGLDAEARRAIRAAEDSFRETCAALEKAPATVAAFRHDDVGFADLAAAPDLEELLQRLLPRAVRRAEGLRALLRAVPTRAVCALDEDALALHAGRLAGLPVHPFSGAEEGERVLQALLTAARQAGMVG